MNTVIFPWSAMVVILASLMLTLYKRDGLVLTISYVVIFLVAPLSSIIAFPNFNYNTILPILVAAHTFFFFGLFFGFALKVKARPAYWEAMIIYNKRLLYFIVTLLFIVILGNLGVYSIIFSHYSIKSLNDLNIAFSDPNIPSLGIYGRMARLAIPAGLLCFTAASYSKIPHAKRILYIFCFLFTLTLIGVRRSILIYQLFFYIMAYLSISRSIWGTFKSIIPISFAALLIIFIFGYVQVSTNKTTSDSPLISGIRDGSLYFSGNLAYTECISQRGESLEKGNAIPIIYTAINRLGNSKDNVTKSFCNISEDVKFNTSPAYFDFFNDYGYIGVAIFMFLISFITTLCIVRAIPMAGLGAIFVTTVLFLFRENLVGQLDIILSILVYPFILFVFVRYNKEEQVGVHK
ncbi:oligosaccharide repeat unit polymerase (plasmid) [Deinococcus sp. KNUC1210]|uniref:O-antigen polymerase n=1 Tax=Deinococcus sp. KNUC1210 TaxID=2917691 RepID=UPI001EF1312B|nr:O-antigen polymerase [Deinococcus sp. KNUC1210]ULH14257.1 oligosaccharide repeat unit polymerase [Deinococcus sp. KNUC1210]